MFNPNGCSHNISWETHCVDCEDNSLKQNIHDLSIDLKAVVEGLQKSPGLSVQPSVIIDLYRTIDRLAMILLRARD